MVVDSVVRRLVELREQAGLTQLETATRMGTSQPVVARLEAGLRDPRLSTLRRYAEAVGAELQVGARHRPTRSTHLSAARLAERVRAQVHAGQSAAGTFREIVQFLDDASVVEPSELRLLIRDEPSATGDDRWDALLAAAVEWSAARGHVASPPWVRSPRRKLAAPGWVVTPYRHLHPFVRANTPAEFARHGVYVDTDSLASV